MSESEGRAASAVSSLQFPQCRAVVRSSLSSPRECRSAVRVTPSRDCKARAHALCCTPPLSFPGAGGGGSLGQPQNFVAGKEFKVKWCRTKKFYTEPVKE